MVEILITTEMHLIESSLLLNVYQMEGKPQNNEYNSICA